MLTNNQQKLSKPQLVDAIKKSKIQSVLVFDISNPSQVKEVEKNILKSIKRGTVSVVLMENN